MNKISICFLGLVTFFFVVETNGQERVASNGKFAIIQGLRIYYEESGKGMPLILLNPFMDTSSSWKPLIPELSKYYRVLALDIPGHGRSDAMDSTSIYSFKKAAEYIIGLIDYLKLDSANIIGPSSPCAIALHISTMRPAFIKNLVIIGGPAYFSQQTRRVITSWGPGFEDDARLAKSIKFHGKEKGMQLQRQLWNFRNSYGDPAFTPDILSTITARTLIIHGDNDEITPLYGALEMYNNINKKYLWVVPHGGHLPHLDPANQSDFTRRLVEFLNGDWSTK